MEPEQLDFRYLTTFGSALIKGCRLVTIFDDAGICWFTQDKTRL